MVPPQSFFAPPEGSVMDALCQLFFFSSWLNGPSCLIQEARNKVPLSALKFTISEFISHLLFVDDVMLFGVGTVREIHSLKAILDFFCSATGMELNSRKSSIRVNEMEAEAREQLDSSFLSRFWI